jgi:hypothetical protein
MTCPEHRNLPLEGDGENLRNSQTQPKSPKTPKFSSQPTGLAGVKPIQTIVQRQFWAILKKELTTSVGTGYIYKAVETK